MVSSFVRFLNAPFFTSLHWLEWSFLPQPDKSLFRKFIGYVLQSFVTLAGTCLFFLSLPFGLVGMLLHISSKKEQKKEDLKLDEISFPPNFKFGFADSFFQSCGIGLTLPGKKEEETSDWNLWIKEKFPDGKPHVEGSPDLSEFFMNYFENPHILIEKLVSLNVSTYRFSLERSVLEPEEGKFDEAYIKKYRTFISKLLENGIQPFVTLHHFVNPAWFLAKGGFEKEENIEGFVKYCEKMCSCFGDLVTHWVTINEPAIYCFQAYLKGMYPPGRKNIALTAKVMRNLMIAHCKAYEACKRINPALQIGVAHNCLLFKAYHFYHPLERLICYYITEITHRAVLRFFHTGRFYLRVPFFASASYNEEKAKNSLDFIGVQYYVIPLIKMTKFTVESACYPGGKMSAMMARFSPEGLKEAIREVSVLKKPIWITETGSDIDQTQYLKTAFSIMSSSLAEGIPLKGALLWTIRDNLEWERGSTVQIGLHHANFEEKPAIQEIVRPVFQKQASQENLAAK